MSTLDTSRLPEDMIEQLKPFIERANEHIGEIAKRRDALRTLVDEIETILESVDEATEDLSIALDRMSQYL